MAAKPQKRDVMVTCDWSETGSHGEQPEVTDEKVGIISTFLRPLCDSRKGVSVLRT